MRAHRAGECSMRTSRKLGMALAHGVVAWTEPRGDRHEIEWPIYYGLGISVV